MKDFKEFFWEYATSLFKIFLGETAVFLLGRIKKKTLYTNNKISEKEIKKLIPFIIASETKYFRYI